MSLLGNDRMGNEDYDQYMRSEWEMFVRQPARAQASLDAVSGISIARVLDIGCGAGHEMLPFVRGGAFGVGVDIAPGSGILGRELFTKEGYGDRVAFMQGTAEHLPFRSGTFDALVCRGVLPYTDNAQALAEMSRVLRPNGVLLLKILGARYYLGELWHGLLQGQFQHMAHAARVMVVGGIYHVTGYQVRNRLSRNKTLPSRWLYRLIRNETFSSRWLLQRELARNSLSIVKEMPESNPRTPSFAVVKNATEDGIVTQSKLRLPRKT
jgi:ubiquinone/menaquinone biosynthesis C-methylase UbiE